MLRGGHGTDRISSERRETPPAPFATIPFSPDPDFVNREDILRQIDERCSEPAARVALVGLGGVGKSQLAIEYAHQMARGRADIQVFWVHAGTQARAEEGFMLIAYYKRRGDKILVFLDNVYALKVYAKRLGRPFLYRRTSGAER
ncbi:hypothetical protein VTI74DRAFT_3243 [Chaetomium olivicolor]